MPKTQPHSAFALSMDEAEKQILMDAIKRAKGNRTHTAEALGITYRHLVRELERLGMWSAVDAMTAEHGWHVQPGPPRKKTAKKQSKPRR